MLAASSASTLQHIELLAAKRRRLEAAQLEAEQAYLVQLHRECGTDDEAVLLQAYAALRAVALPSFTVRWAAVFGSVQRLSALHAQRGRERPNHADGRSWVGVAPLPYTDVGPGHGQSVVYVLYDAHNVPCYVGSTSQFRTRLKAHISDGKPVVSWTAFPCSNREEAYELEGRLLREHKPYLNRRAGR